MTVDNKKIYNENWELWIDMKVYGPASRYLQFLFFKLLNRHIKNKKINTILDIGCGEGTNTDLLSKKFPNAHTIGIDFSEKGIECATSKYGSEKLQFITDLTSEKLKNNYDLITCFEVLEHVEDWQSLLLRMTYSTNKYLLLSFPTGRMRDFEKNVGHLRNFKKNEVEDFLQKNGFQQKEVFYAGFPFFSPIYRDICNITNAANNNFTKGNYGFSQKVISSIIYFCFKYFCFKRKGDYFVGLFEKKISNKDLSDLLSNELCLIDEITFENVKTSFGDYYAVLSKLDSLKITCDALNPLKGIIQAEILEKYCTLKGKKTLEIGSGFGINHIVWTKKYQTDGYGIEPDSEGFNNSFKISQSLLKINNLDENRIINACGENIPFPDNHFDIIYSTNVLEHVMNPKKVLCEALRVLKPGGFAQIIFPNYHSFFDGHYSVFHPPILSNKMFELWVKYIFRRNPQYSKTLRTELNVFWTRRELKKLEQSFNFEIISLGQEIFLERMKFINFETWAGLVKIKPFIVFAKILKVNILFAKIFLLFRCWTPIILTLKKRE